MRIPRGVTALTAAATVMTLGACNARSVPADGTGIMDNSQIDRMLAGRSPSCRKVMVEWMAMRHESRSLWLTASDVDELDRQTSSLGPDACDRILAQRLHVADLTTGSATAVGR